MMAGMTPTSTVNKEGAGAPAHSTQRGCLQHDHRCAAVPVQLPPEPLRMITNDRRPRAAAWSARLPVTQEIAGPNPVEGRLENGAVHANRQSGATTLAVPEPS